MKPATLEFVKQRFIDTGGRTSSLRPPLSNANGVLSSLTLQPYQTGGIWRYGPQELTAYVKSLVPARLLLSLLPDAGGVDDGQKQAGAD